MTDSLASRAKFAVLIPSTNTIVQPEFDSMRPHGVTNHISRIRIPDIPLHGDQDFSRLIDLIATAQDEAVDSVLSAAPTRLILGISAETFWDGLDASSLLETHLRERSHLPVTMGSTACVRALETLHLKRVSIITPYQPIGDQRVHQFFTQAGFEIGSIIGLRCESPMLISHVSEQQLISVAKQFDLTDIDGIVQVGTNLAMARLAPWLEIVLGIPVVAINTAIYWDALRSSDIHDSIPGFGRLLTEF